MARIHAYEVSREPPSFESGLLSDLVMRGRVPNQKDARFGFKTRTGTFQTPSPIGFGRSSKGRLVVPWQAGNLIDDKWKTS